eukprot:1159587-Pelagomonas_calceolata.AAC.3
MVVVLLLLAVVVTESDPVTEQVVVLSLMRWWWQAPSCVFRDPTHAASMAVTLCVGLPGFANPYHKKAPADFCNKAVTCSCSLSNLYKQVPTAPKAILEGQHVGVAVHAISGIN